MQQQKRKYLLWTQFIRSKIIFVSFMTILFNHKHSLRKNKFSGRDMNSKRVKQKNGTFKLEKDQRTKACGKRSYSTLNIVHVIAA